jgi:hypothetical protein
MCRGIADSNSVIPGASIPNPLTACSVVAMSLAVNFSVQDATRGATAASAAFASGVAEFLAFSLSRFAISRGLVPRRIVEKGDDLLFAPGIGERVEEKAR